MNVRPWIVLMLLLTGCPGEAPCTDCPPIEGTWFLQYLAPDFPCDGGTPAAPPMTVSITREGSVLRSAMDGIPLTGTLYEGFEFSLNGQSTPIDELVSMRGIFRPATTADGGDSQLYDGLLTRDLGACHDRRRFTGARY